MIAKFICRVGTTSSRCAKKLARVTAFSSNSQLGLKKALTQQVNPCRSFTALAAPNIFNSLSAVQAPILNVADPAAVGRRSLQTKGDKELLDFLEDEISAEKKSHKKLPDVSPFEAKFNDAEVTFTRKVGNEKIIIKFNVNNSVDIDEQTDEQTDEQVQTISTPNFTVEIERGGKVLSLACSFADNSDDDEPTRQEDNYADLFTVNELSVYEGDFSETTYSTAGDILNADLYDHLVNILEDRGITNEFVQKLSDYSTVYEHQRYIGLLENLKKFFN